MTESSSIIIGLALVFYTIGVWGERIQGELKWWQLIFFWGGLVFDTWGTGMMFEMTPGLTLDIHSITGTIAIVLMLVHAVWATVVLITHNERWIKEFHKFSIAVWFIWLIPYFSPMFFALGG